MVRPTYQHVIARAGFTLHGATSRPTHGRRQGGAGGAMAPPGFSHTLSKSSQISKILPFLVVNTGSILIGPPPENFSADALGPTLGIFATSFGQI